MAGDKLPSIRQLNNEKGLFQFDLANSIDKVSHRYDWEDLRKQINSTFFFKQIGSSFGVQLKGLELNRLLTTEESLTFSSQTDRQTGCITNPRIIGTQHKCERNVGAPSRFELVVGVQVSLK